MTHPQSVSVANHRRSGGRSGRSTYPLKGVTRMPRKPIRHAVVVGASMAGLTPARVLADHAATVTVLDRDDLPAGYDARKGVPQGRHAHAILAGGALAMEGLFPGLMAEMVDAGAGLLDFN